MRFRAGFYRPSRGALKSCAGAALLECALLLVPLMLVVGGLIDAGYLLKRSNLALAASKAGARAESVAFHNLFTNSPAPLACATKSCAEDCEGTAFTMGHRAACGYLSKELGSKFSAQDWLVAISPSPVLYAELGIPTPLPTPTANRRVYRTATVSISLAPGVRPCLVCFMGHFLQVGVTGESTYLLHQ